jgi:hypothetical protein
MGETRLEKYRKYRESLNEVKAENKTPVAIKNRDYNVVTDKLNTTSTLPLDEVLGQISEEDNKVSKKLITKKRLQIFIFAAIGVLLVAGSIVFAIIAFGGK